ncbi:MAG TPA: hypothetical protein VLH80_07570 [Nitrospiraceae bacterium]|nr:hypothetical protein [Nitrospiraceae bacterium]
MADKVSFGNGDSARVERWPFSKLKPGKYFEITDLSQHVALRTAASRARKKHNTTFIVRKMTRQDGTPILRVYRE